MNAGVRVGLRHEPRTELLSAGQTLRLADHDRHSIGSRVFRSDSVPGEIGNVSDRGVAQWRMMPQHDHDRSVVQEETLQVPRVNTIDRRIDSGRLLNIDHRVRYLAAPGAPHGLANFPVARRQDDVSPREALEV